MKSHTLMSCILHYSFHFPVWQELSLNPYCLIPKYQPCPSQLVFHILQILDCKHKIDMTWHMNTNIDGLQKKAIHQLWTFSYWQDLNASLPIFYWKGNFPRSWSWMQYGFRIFWFTGILGVDVTSCFSFQWHGLINCGFSESSKQCTII